MTGRMPLASNRGDHFLLILARADGDAFNRHVLRHRQSRGDLSGNTGQHADQGDMTTATTGVDRLGQCSRSANLDDSVNPMPGQSCCGSTPFQIALVVDQVVRAEALQTCQLFIGRGRGDYGRAGRLGELNCKVETPPVPWVSTTSPGLIRASTINARQAVRAAQGNVAAWTKLHPLAGG